ncbi:hypothetical protein UCRPC4_g03540 [Phaeomoniella chlamydospora]|uniref:Mediator of RNA polymerase II transcription subunit 1 n=1 Tax=Phaeomoniella chlamydospora TaxID=158046 RepID=A0A0G2EGM7_PHACM|nr:hypothetical protein UCRPC4_g03540 [Phaeomoniella chlamydospora]
MALGEDAAGFSSPAAAILASLGAHGSGLTPAAGLTPLAMGSAGDGLGITNAPDLQMSASQLDGNAGVKDPELERERRLNEIIAMLKTRVAGRGVCREAIERLAQLAGFTFLWQDDTLTIAGNSVDLEIDFHPGSDRVRDVSLKIAMSAEVEAEGKEEASRVLKRDLMQDDGVIGWKQLNGFSQNLDRLGRLDKLSQGINCFEAIEGLYESFRKIWSEEKHRMRKLSTLRRLSKGGIGRPIMHRGDKFGLALEYWAPKAALTERTSTPGDVDAMETDEDETVERKSVIDAWSGRIECEAGYPSLRVSKDWVSQEALRNSSGENSTDNLANAWLDPAPSMITEGDSNMETDDAARNVVPQSPNVRFVLELEPEVLLPLGVASEALNTAGVSLARDGRSMVDILEHVKGMLKVAPHVDGQHPSTFLRWKKEVTSFVDDSIRQSNPHSLLFRTNGQVWCCPVQAISFDHPRQIASFLPVLRQYALLWTLLRSSVKGARSDDEAKVSTDGHPPISLLREHGTTRKKSNLNPQRARLDKLLKEADALAEAPTIDMTLGFTPGHLPQPILDLRFPLFRDLTSLPSGQPAFGNICIEIGLGAQIRVSKAENLPLVQGVSGRRKLARVLELSEDIPTLVAWVHDLHAPDRK